MKRRQSIEAFSNDRGIPAGETGMFNVFANGGYCSEPHLYNRRDFYKISLLQGACRLQWHHQTIDINRPALVFYNPRTPFAWEPLSPEQPGYFCFFKESFFQGSARSEGLQHSLLFTPGTNPVCFLDAAQNTTVSGIFEKMLTVIASDYIYKYDFLRSHLSLLMHEALMSRADTLQPRQYTAAERLTTRFFDLLERQFPIDSTERALELKTAGAYAQALAVHVNHLNAAVREVTGKSTSIHIADRILAEAKALLKHTDWSVTEIAYALGFEYPNYFYQFYKKKTGDAPKRSRETLV